VDFPKSLTSTQLIAVDLDNTLLSPEKQVRQRTATAVGGLRKAGISVVPVTARGLWDVLRLLPSAPFGPHCICGNGAIIFSIPDQRVIELTALSLAEAHKIVVDVRTAIPGVSFGAEWPDGLIGERWIIEMSLSSGDATRVPDVKEHLRAPLVKLMCSAPGWSPAALLAVATESVGTRASVTHSEGDWVEICAPDVDKASALARTCRQLGVERDRVICVGDQLNDLDMLMWSGTAVAVANAIPAILQVADVVIPSNAEEGVAQLMEKLINCLPSRT
jgi:Cof subfamily protein (haloacid dehalogenase superfamily)